MSGRSQQDQKKREARSADMGQSPAPPGWVKHQENSDPAWDDTAIVPVLWPSWDQELQIVQRTRRHPQTGQLVDFCVSIQIRGLDVDEGWCDIERVDCCHGYVHVDRQSVGGGLTMVEECIPHDARGDLDRALKWALDYAWNLDERLKGWG